MKRCLAVVALFSFTLSGCTRNQTPPGPGDLPGRGGPVISSSQPGSGPNRPGLPPGKTGLPEVPGSWSDHPTTPKTAAPGVVSPPPATPAPPIATSEGP